MSWWEYVQEVSGQASQTEIARRTGLKQPSVNRWQGIVPKPDNVIAFANAYNRPVVEAFVAAGYLTEEQVQLTEVQANVTTMPTDALVDLLHNIGDELRRRVNS